MNRSKLFLTLMALCLWGAIVAQSSESAKAAKPATKGVPPVCHSKIGDMVQSANGDITLKVVGRKLNMGKSTSELSDSDIYSPKSARNITSIRWRDAVPWRMMPTPTRNWR